MSETNDASNESNSLSNDSSVRFTSTSGGGGAVATQSILRASSLLRPSKLGSQVISSPKDSPTVEGVALGSQAFRNPFLREQSEEDEGLGEIAGGSKAAGSGDALNGAPCFSGKAKAADNQKDDNKASCSTAEKSIDDEEADDRPDPLTMLRRNGLERANLFAAAKSSIPRVEKSGFVFGQNVHERVVGENISKDNGGPSTSTGSAAASGSASVFGGAGSNELLFSSVIEKAKASENEANAPAGTQKSLDEVAREYEESRAQKRKYDAVETRTGEEDEINILDIHCKLFNFVNSNYEELGRGSLRLNDFRNQEECSRLVFRSSGSFRLLLNTKVWGGMVAHRAGQKSLRVTASADGKFKIFLIMARPADIVDLFNALTERIEKRKLSHPEECEPPEDNGLSEAAAKEADIVKDGEKNGTATDAIANTPEDKSEINQNANTETVDAKDDLTKEEEGEPSPKKKHISEAVSETHAAETQSDLPEADQ